MVALSSVYYSINPEYAEKCRQHKRDKYKNDPEYRQKAIARALASYYRRHPKKEEKKEEEVTNS